jgi:hypothetical protein
VAILDVYIFCDGNDGRGFRPVGPGHRFRGRGLGGGRGGEEEERIRRPAGRPAGYLEGPDMGEGDVMQRQHPWLGLAKIVGFFLTPRLSPCSSPFLTPRLNIF